MPNNRTIDNRAPSNTFSQPVPVFTSIEVGSALITSSNITYSQSNITYSQAGINYGGVVSTNEGNPPKNLIQNQ